MPRDSFSAVLNGFSDCAFIVDAARNLRASNDAARLIFGETPLGQDFVRVMRRPEVLRMIDQVLKGQERAQAVMSLDGALRGTFRVTVARIGEEGAVISFTDLSPIRAAEQMRSDFIANVSHELRSPLTALAGFIETLRGPARGDSVAQDRFLGMMDREAARMTRLIKDLLSLSKVEVNARIQPTDPVDVTSVIRRVMATLTHYSAKENVRVELDAPDLPIVSPGDEDELTQVFQNLIENAIKYGGANKLVLITARVLPSAPGMSRPTAQIDIRDQGPGIGREHIPRLTERFYRVDTGRSRDKGGTGLGLAIVKHIIQRHRGRMLIESEPGDGACFTILLPVAAAAAPSGIGEILRN